MNGLSTVTRHRTLWTQLDSTVSYVKKLCLHCRWRIDQSLQLGRLPAPLRASISVLASPPCLRDVDLPSQHLLQGGLMYLRDGVVGLEFWRALTFYLWLDFRKLGLTVKWDILDNDSSRLHLFPDKSSRSKNTQTALKYKGHWGQISPKSNHFWGAQ